MRRLALAMATLFPSVVFADGKVTSIAPQRVLDAVAVPQGQGFAGYLTALHGVGVAAVAAIAVVMIVWGATQVFGESVWGKTQGKAKVWNAVWGLLLAAGSFVILRTVSDSLVRADFGLAGELGAETRAAAIGAPDSGGTANRPTDDANILDGFRTQSGSMADAIAAAAEYAAANQVNTCKYTPGGRTSCAYAADDIIEAATGHSVTGSGLVTQMFSDLQESQDFDQITGGFAAARRGDIVISPNGDRRHVGIITADGGAKIVSNSSSSGSVQQNYRNDTWTTTYGADNVYIFRPTGSLNAD